jgi:hypothetical protein
MEKNKNYPLMVVPGRELTVARYNKTLIETEWDLLSALLKSQRKGDNHGKQTS